MRGLGPSPPVPRRPARSFRPAGSGEHAPDGAGPPAGGRPCFADTPRRSATATRGPPGPAPALAGTTAADGLATHDATCRSLAAGSGAVSGAVVVSADYRLDPEHPWPAAPDDALNVLLWARARALALGCDPGRVVVAGESSGGNLAAVTALRAPELVAGQLLVYPPLDAAMATESAAAYGEGHFHLACEPGRVFGVPPPGRLRCAPH
ncbi:alpha/beta hydrolase fold domain-containing protein [Streptomyces roseus]|uniref:alpha/beta hydrolase fold domain-containing protein n=1 Tax=Streptomyces roseus TaxID=66430 RepID=UPI0038231E96